MINDVLRSGLDASDTLNEIINWMNQSVKTAREPIDIGDWDVVTVRGELTDMKEYLQMAERQNNAIRGSFVDLIALIRRLQITYHYAYKVWRETQQDAETAFREGESAMLARFITEVNDDTMDLLLEIVRTLGTLAPEERAAQLQELRAALKSDPSP